MNERDDDFNRIGDFPTPLIAAYAAQASTPQSPEGGAPCYDCQQVTSGRCWRHSQQTITVPPIIRATPVPESAPIPGEARYWCRACDFATPSADASILHHDETGHWMTHRPPASSRSGEAGRGEPESDVCEPAPSLPEGTCGARKGAFRCTLPAGHASLHSNGHYGWQPACPYFGWAWCEEHGAFHIPPPPAPLPEGDDGEDEGEVIDVTALTERNKALEEALRFANAQNEAAAARLTELEGEREQRRCHCGHKMDDHHPCGPCEHAECECIIAEERTERNEWYETALHEQARASALQAERDALQSHAARAGELEAERDAALALLLAEGGRWVSSDRYDTGVICTVQACQPHRWRQVGTLGFIWEADG